MGAITDQVKNLASRVTALESSEANNQTEITSIVKLYNTIEVEVTITTRKYRTLTPSDDLYPSDTLYDDYDDLTYGS